MATWLLRNEGASLPQSQHLQKFSSVVLLGDFLEKPEDIAATVRSLASRGVSGHIVQIIDPAEETLPYDGRVEFRDMDGPLKYLAGKTELLREAYIEKFAGPARGRAPDCPWRKLDLYPAPHRSIASQAPDDAAWPGRRGKKPGL